MVKVVVSVIVLFMIFRKAGLWKSLIVSGIGGMLVGGYVFWFESWKDGFYGIVLGSLIAVAGIVLWAIGRKKKKRKEKEKSITLKEYLNRRVVGQERAVEGISRVLVRNLKKQEKTGEVRSVIGTFFFVGQTGVGKTEMAKAMGEWFSAKFGHQFLRFDMGNFHDGHTASTLVGSSKGYIGSDEGGALTRPLMKNPRAVILFDEIEKAHPSLYRTFMSLIDEGEIQETSTGIHVRLKQSVIIFTSNLYQRTIKEIDRKIEDEVEKELLIRDVLTGNLERALEVAGREAVEEDLRRFTGDERFETKGFPPEFVGRIDKVIVFNELTDEDLAKIVAMKMVEYGIVKNQEDINKKANEIWEMVRKYSPIARKYGVRMFIKKIEEELL